MALPWPFRKPAQVAGIATHTATDGRDLLVNDPDNWEISQPWLWWDGPAGGDGSVGPFGNPPPGAGWPGFAGKGGGVPAVTRCTSLISDTIAGLPWHVYRDREKLTTPDWLADPQALRLDERIIGAAVPDARFSRSEFWSQVIVSILWYGEGILYVPVRDETGRPVPPIWALHPDDVKVIRGRYVVGTESDNVELGADELIVIRGLTRPGKVRGVGVLQAHWHDLGLASQIREYTAGTLSRGVPAGYLKVNAPDLTEDEAETLKARWMAAHGGSRKKIAVLNATTDFHALELDAKSMELIELRRYSILDIALLFGIPPYKLGIDANTGLTYSNPESRGMDFVQDALSTWITRLQDTLTGQFPRGTQMKVKLAALLKADTMTRYRAHEIALRGGWATVDEIRDMEDLPPLPDQQIRVPALAVPQNGAGG